MSHDASRNGLGALPWYILALALILLDQYTKGLATQSLEYAQPVEVFFWFNLTLHHNTGAAFSFLSDAGGWQHYFFTGIAAVVSAVLVVWLMMIRRDQKLLAVSLALILSGALGNFWDRVTLGYVVDFISVHYGGYYFPTFNIADSAITVGAGFMILDSFINRPGADDAAGDDR